MGVIFFLNKAPKALIRFIKYGIVGFTTSSLEVLLLFLLVHYISVYYILATALAFVLSDSLGFAINFKWGFKESKTGTLRGYNLYILFSVFSLVLTLLLMKIFVDALGIHYILSRIIIIAFTGMCTFTLNYLITFKMAQNIREELRFNY
jgi:putative flippase GtrA